MMNNVQMIKQDDGRMRSDPRVVDLVPFISGVVNDLQPKADQKKLRLLYKPTSKDDAKSNSARRMTPVYYVNVDNDHLREVMTNLIENAIKYTPSGDVTVDIDGDNEHVKVSIQDTGIGIPAEDISHLFQKFYRVDNSDTREIGGTGLGLYLCRRLVETMNGRIWVESEYKKGSTFFVELPRVSHESAQSLIQETSIEAEKEAHEQATAALNPQPAPATTSNG
jgi:signal transduction histidine kinase